MNVLLSYKERIIFGFWHCFGFDHLLVQESTNVIHINIETNQYYFFFLNSISTNTELLNRAFQHLFI